jgi:hypothetical protein
MNTPLEPKESAACATLESSSSLSLALPFAALDRWEQAYNQYANQPEGSAQRGIDLVRSALLYFDSACSALERSDHAGANVSTLLASEALRRGKQFFAGDNATCRWILDESGSELDIGIDFLIIGNAVEARSALSSVCASIVRIEGERNQKSEWESDLTT